MIEQNENEIVFVFDQSILFQTLPGKTGYRMNPNPGFGGRAFMCDHYDACLYHAACNEWSGFHCERCIYEKRGFISFYLKEFVDLDPEDDCEDIDYNRLKRACTMLP